MGSISGSIRIALGIPKMTSFWTGITFRKSTLYPERRPIVFAEFGNMDVISISVVAQNAVPSMISLTDSYGKGSN